MSFRGFTPTPPTCAEVTIDTDLREGVSLLTQMDVDLDDFHLERIIVSPLGPDRRRASHDVSEIREKRFEDDLPYILMKVNRKGLFDTLPVGLFI